MTRPLVFDIHRTATHDGPGIRTTVFFKGCNLNCAWCHNPEGKAPEAQLAVFAEKCTACGACKSVCKHPDECAFCTECVAICPKNARTIYGKSYTDEELLSIVLADKAYFDATGGGVTFSGGECMLYPETIACLAEKCKLHGVHVAVDTAGNVPYSHFERVLPFVDLFLYDIKALDSQLHESGTGCPNELILQNLERLRQTGKKIIVRTPVIPNFNDGEELQRIVTYCAERNLPLQTLPYHELGIDKLHAIHNANKKSL